jgi:hypothetical protein
MPKDFSLPTETDGGALDLIAELLSGQEWDAATLDDVAELVRATGRTVADVSYEREE